MWRDSVQRNQAILANRRGDDERALSTVERVTGILARCSGSAPLIDKPS